MGIHMCTPRHTRRHPAVVLGLCILSLIVLWAPGRVAARIYIDINAPSVRKFTIAIPDFIPVEGKTDHPDLTTVLPGVLASDLDLSGYFSPMDKEAFLESEQPAVNPDEVRLKDWSVIGAEVLVKGRYTCIGNSLEVEIKVYDVFWGRQILGKRMLGETDHPRRVIHRLGNELIRLLTGHDGMFLSSLSFVSTGTGHKEIYVSDFDGHNVTRITHDENIALAPEWSSDGKKLLYTSFRNKTGVLFMRDVAAGTVKELSARKGLNLGASWRPRTDSIALTLSENGEQDIYTIDLEGKKLERLTNQWGIDVSPTFSPDGTRMAFVSNRSGTPQIYVKDLATGTENRITFEGNYNTSPAWSSTGRIAFVSLNRGFFDIYTVDPDGSRLKRLTDEQGNNEDPCWSPDGRYLVYSSNRQGPYHLYLMTGHGQNHRRITFLDGEQTAPSWAP